MFGLNSFNQLTLRARIAGVMLAMLGASLFTNYLASNEIEDAALDEVQSHVETLSKAVEVSVQQLHIQGKSSELILKDYLSRLRSDGVQEITLLDPERRILASTSSAKLNPDPNANQKKGVYEPYDLTIPIVADEKLLGYVHLKLALSNLKQLFRDLLYSRMFLSLSIFGLGILIAFPVVSYITLPIKGLTFAARQVAGGNFDVDLPQTAGADIAQLVSSFKHMVNQLKHQKELETKIIENEQAAAVGRMASGIAHDIRNPLNFVNLGVEHLQHSWRIKGLKNFETDKLFDGIHAELTRISEMVQDFLDYGKPRTPRLQPEKPGEILLESVDEVRRRHEEDEPCIRIESSDRSCFIRVEKALVKRVLVNLLENAMEAGQMGVQVEAGWNIRDENQVVLWVQDEGQGIPLENMGRIFTPYFTTKRSGIGLGLALAHKWVQEMGGTITTQNVPYRGARFEVSFPRELDGPIETV